MILTQTKRFVKAPIFIYLSQQFRLIGYKLFYTYIFILKQVEFEVKRIKTNMFTDSHKVCPRKIASLGLILYYVTDNSG